MKKSQVPTSKLSIFCDHFDTVLNAEIHVAKPTEHKLLLSIGPVENKDNKQELSLYKEDVEALIGVLTALLPNVAKR